jgi:hypothetical protein
MRPELMASSAVPAASSCRPDAIRARDRSRRAEAARRGLDGPSVADSSRARMCRA